MDSVSPPVLGESWPFIGRDAQVDRLSAALRHEARSVFLYGPSGVGKTTLAGAVGARLESENWLVLRILGSPALTPVPFAAFAGSIAGHLPASATVSTTDPVALFTTTHAILSDLAGTRSILMLVDDLTAVDTVSLTLVAQLVAAGRLRIIATIQEHEPVPDAALPLAIGAESVRLDLAPFEVAEVEALLTAVLGEHVARRDVVELHAASRGNPMFLRELLLGAVETGSLVHADGHWRLTRRPEGTPALRDLIRARLRRLDAEQRDVVERLAVCQALGVDEFARAEAIPALAELEARGVVRVEQSGSGPVVTLSHAHDAAAVRAAMPRVRAIALLLEQATLVAARPMSAADELRVERWRLDAGSPADGALLLRAAELARGTSDHRTAARLTAAAIASGIDDPATHLRHAELSWALGRGAAALASLERAEREAARSELPRGLRAAIAAKRAEIYGGDGQNAARGIALLDEVARLVPEERPGLLLATASLKLQLMQAHDAQDLIAQAGAFLAGHPAGEAILALARAVPLAYLQRTDEAVDAARAAVAHAALPGASFSSRQATMVLAGVLIETDDYPGARAATIEALHQSIRDDDQFTTRLGEFSMARIFWLMGRLDTAVRWLRDTVSGAELYGPASLRSPALALACIIACEQGDLPRALDLRARMDASYDRSYAMTVFADGWIARLQGRTDEAAEILRAGAEQMLACGGFGTAGKLLHTIARLGSATHSADAARRLEALAPLAPSRRIRLQARHARAEADKDPLALRSVGADWEDLGALLYAAECFASAGRIARAAGAGRDGAADAQHAAALVAACEGARTPLLQFADGAPLTAREREIASLAAQGLTSNEIAQRLFLSPRTVNNHLQSTYTKLGIRGRHELTP